MKIQKYLLYYFPSSLHKAGAVKTEKIAGGTSNAISAAELALADVESEIPADEVIETMYRVGRSMPADIRETGIGGLVGTKTGKRMAKELFGIDRWETTRKDESKNGCKKKDCRTN